jgi:hypothetical protein
METGDTNMTLQDILTGPAADRHCHAMHLMTEAEARGILLKADRQMAKKNRGPIFRKFADSPHGRLTDDARALYRAYAKVYGA